MTEAIFTVAIICVYLILLHIFESKRVKCSYLAMYITLKGSYTCITLEAEVTLASLVNLEFWLGKILMNDVRFAKFAKVFPLKYFKLCSIYIRMYLYSNSLLMILYHIT